MRDGGPDPAAGRVAWSRYGRVRDEAREMAISGPTVGLFERLCSLEQTVSDIAAVFGELARAHEWRRSLEGLRAAAVETAGAVWFGRTVHGSWDEEPAKVLASLPDPDELDALWRDRAARGRGWELSEYLDVWPIWPECLSSEPVSYRAYANRAVNHVRTMRPAPDVVIGLRSSGSFLGPIWAAALRAAGFPPRFLTLRPTHRSLRMRHRALPPLMDSRGDVALIQGRHAIVVDDLLGTGATLRSTLEAMGRAESRPASMSVSLYRCSSVGRTARRLGISEHDLRPVRRAYARWPQAARQAPPLDRVRDYFQKLISGRSASPEVVQVTQLDAGYGLRYLSTITGSPTSAASAHVHGGARNRRYLLRIRDRGTESLLVAKPLGFGYFAADERRRLSRLPYYAPVAGVRGGYLMYVWQEGSPMPFRDRTGIGRISVRDLEVISTVTASAVRQAPGGVLLPRTVAEARIRATIDDLRRSGVEGLPTPRDVVEAFDDTWLPVVPASPNSGHWHYLRGPGGQLIKLHREVANVVRRSDPVEDLAAAGVELALTPAEVIHATEGYVALTGDHPSPGRLCLGVMCHISRGLREFAFYRDQVAPTLGRRVSSGPTAFTRRGDGLRHAIGLAVGLLEHAR
jgi:adenine/guanine phosphoribosyltransferase-like PRPP-binding protein